MCSTLRYGTDPNSSVKIGNPVPITLAESGISQKAIFAGHAQKEKLSWWKNVGAAKPVTIQVDSFIEGKAECKVQSGHFIGIILNKNVVVNGKIIGRVGSIKILTRPAITPFEVATHPRWPLAPTLNHQGFQLWNQGDLI